MNYYKIYEQYKDSGIEWILDIPEHWEVRKFGYLFSFDRGLSITKDNLRDSGIPCVSYGEIHSKYRFEVNPDIHELKCVDEDYLLSNNKSLIKRGDFVFADTSEDIEGSGNFTLLDSDSIVFAGYHTIIARLIYFHNYRYLAYLFESFPFRSQIRCQVSGIKVFSITQTILKKAKVILPPLKEQQAIANILDQKTTEIDSLIVDKERLIELLQEKRQAIISEYVTKGLNTNVKMKDSGIEWIGDIPEHWRVIKLGHVAKITRLAGAEYTSYWKTSEEGEIVALRGYNIGENKLLLDDVERISEQLSQKLIRSRLFKGDVVFPCVGTIGKATLILEDNKYHINQNIAKLTTSESLSSKYLTYFLNSNLCYYQIVYHNTSDAQPSVLVRNLRRFLLILPPIDEQEDIADRIEDDLYELDSLIDDIKMQVKNLKEYRQSLISEAVTGKIDVSDYETA